MAWSGRSWIALASAALRYPTTAPGAAANIAVNGHHLYATMADAGVAVYRIADGRRIGLLAPPVPGSTADDVAVADGLLFVLDARPPGMLSVFTLRDPARPAPVSGPLPVAVGPFSGVTAANGIVVVSGGTSSLTAFRYDERGVLPPAGFARADLGRGQPDALLSAFRPILFVATHYAGPRFGLDIAAIDASGIRRIATIPLPGAGFTDGGEHPASFPIAFAELSRDTLLVAHGGGLAIVRVTDPSHPVLLHTIDLGAPAIHVDAMDGAALVALRGGLALVRLAPEISMVRLPSTPRGTRHLGVALTQSRAMVAAGDRGVLFMDR